MKANAHGIKHLEPDDDAPVGKVLSRREVLGILAGLAGAAVLAACDVPGSSTSLPASTVAPTRTPATSGGANGAATQTPLSQEAATAIATTPVEASPTANAVASADCVVRPEETEGPYFVDEKLNRSDIRSDPSDGSVKEGAALQLAFLVSQIAANKCTPLPNAQIDVWHCDAMGVYSDTIDPSWNTKGKKFLRGYQLTGTGGKAQFTTIYPGWYRGRTVHIHFKIRTTSTTGQSYEFTSQLFFDDSLTDQVFAQQPYSGRGTRDTRNSNDGIYRSGGSQLTLAPTKSGDGYAATFSIALDLSDMSVGKSDSFR
jgi:protocatechuate 3,4-dioxygenase beta subunit